MKEGSHKFPVGGPSLPRPELNPLTNPVLGRNLGRWAQVYFTSPPEKREQAVTDLLRELETEPALEQGQAAAPPHRAIDPSPVVSALREARDSVQPAVETAEIECEKCGHVTSTENRYCGFCGGPLGEVAGIDNQVGPPTDTAPIQIESDHELEWLRNKDLASFQVSQGRSLGWVKYAVALFAIAVAGFLYFQYGNRLSPAVQSSSPAVPNTAAQQTAQPARPERALPDPKNDKHLIQAASLKKEQPPAAPQPAASTDSDNRAALPSAGASDPDLRLAQAYLRQSNASDAARLLWKAVGRNNTEAALTLSQLYARGEGVTRNCDQARILLVAAAKRGSAAAAEQLRQFDSAACR